jgi:hypothetical protein
MSSESYNLDQVTKGLLTGNHISTLTEAWQEDHGLKVDGYCGPATRGSLEESSHNQSTLGVTALDVAIENLGKGEEGGNNSGEFVEMLHKKNYDGDPDDDGAWCAAFVSYCFEAACERLGVDLPFRRSTGAKSLFRKIGAAGEFVTDPQPGDVVCWDRGVKGSWQGHIGIVERCENGILYTVEGNVGRYPSVVRRFAHNLDLQPRLEGFARCPNVSASG